jgi:hypothetical protein
MDKEDSSGEENAGETSVLLINALVPVETVGLKESMVIVERCGEDAGKTAD